MWLLTIFVSSTFLFSLVSRPVERSPFTPPIIFTVVGLAASLLFADVYGDPESREAFLTVAELGLVLLLFADACHCGLGLLTRDRWLPIRLLAVGMPLTIALGVIAALLLFDHLSVWQAGILAAVLAPTDAGLGQVIVKDQKLPRLIREALNVEAGLNDGLAVPFLLFFMSFASTAAGHEASLVRFILEQVGLGAGIGVVVGRGGGWLFLRAYGRGWVGETSNYLALLSLPVLCLLVAKETGGSAFIAAFVAGLALPRRDMHASKFGVQFVEDWGQLINFAVFFLFGFLIASRWSDLRPIHFLYGALSLTVVRMLPVALSLIRSGLSPATVAFVGWFGPRGLASIVLGLVYYEHLSGDTEPAIELCVMATVLMSIFAHGITAKPGAAHLARAVARLPDTVPERVG